MIGETIGNFQIVARIGRGGMGEVFLAQQRSIETQVAIKMLLPEVSADKDHVRRFFNEARAVSRIKHAGIVKIFDVGYHRNGHAYLIMEYLEGESLADRLQRVKRMTLTQLCDVGRQIASVLDATHAVGIIHRDLKPDNIFLVHDRELPSGERAKVLDFGIAKLTDTFSGPRTLGTMGTPTYMAPEQWGDSAHVDWRADLYSLGCVVFEMATGRPPFDAATIPELYRMHLTEPVPSVRAIAPDMPAGLEQMIHLLLQKNPAARPDSIQSVIRMFDTLTSSSPYVITLPAHDPNKPVAAPPVAPKKTPPLHIDDVNDTVDRNTTLSRASMEVRPGGAPNRVVPIALTVAIAVVVAMIAVVAKHKGTHHVAAAATPATGSAEMVTIPPVPTPAVVPAAIDAAVEEAPWPQWLDTANPYVTYRGLSVMSHQVTRGEYHHYIDALPEAERGAQVPVYGWDDSAPGDALAWLPQERAARFCKAIGARLPTTSEWKTLSGGSWGIDPTGEGKLGPLREWTATVQDGLADVMGGHVKMSPVKLAHVGKTQKDVESAAPKNAAMDTIAEDTIGFRCVK